MKAEFSLNTMVWQNALRLYSANSKKSGKEILQGRAKVFVRDVMKVTPPNKGKAGGKALGEASVRGDLARAIVGSNRRDAGNAEALHLAARGSRGSVPKNRKPLPAKGVPAYRKQVVARVGKLISGWATSAQRLGVSVPGWVSRHGTGRGSVRIRLSWPDISITVVNRVRYVSEIRVLTRRIQFALDENARNMLLQVEHRLRRDARKSGFK